VRFDGSQAAVCATSLIVKGRLRSMWRSVLAWMGETPQSADALRNQPVCLIIRSKKARDSWWATCVDGARGGTDREGELRMTGI
jgi:hypothetical protein